MAGNTLFILAAIGLVAGILGGMIGLGGGIIMIPAMMMFLAMDQKMAQGTSVAVMLPPIGILAVYNYYKAGYINVPYAIIIAVAFMIGGYFGSKAALLMPAVIMKRMFAVLLVVIAIKMALDKN